MAETFIVEPQYFPPIAYFGLFLQGQVCWDIHANYEKQSYRNRCEILTSQGKQPLSVPIIHSGQKTPFHEVAIDYTQNWPVKHWRAIQSAYGKSPFFEHYSPLFEPLFQKRHNSLLALNQEVMTLCLKLLQLSPNLSYTENYVNYTEGQENDFRSKIHPKKKIPSRLSFRPVSYMQVFGSMFVQNLSVIDLIFCEGPNAIKILRRSFPLEN